MKEVAFSVPLTGIVRIDGNSVSIIVNRASTSVVLEAGGEAPGRTAFEPGTTMFDVLLDSAREFLRRKTYNRFRGSDLFTIARERYPTLNKRSFMTRLAAASPNHPSYKYHLARRDYFSRIATGIYSLENQYLPKKTTSEVESPGLIANSGKAGPREEV